MPFNPPYNSGTEIRTRMSIVGNLNIAPATVTASIRSADSIVDGFIGGVYALPLSTTSSTVKELAGEMACAIILKQQFGPEVEDTDKDGFKKWDAVIEQLELIQEQKMKLFTDTTPRTEFVRNDDTTVRGFPDNASDQLTSTLSTAPVFRRSSIW